MCREVVLSRVIGVVLGKVTFLLLVFEEKARMIGRSCCRDAFAPLAFDSVFTSGVSKLRPGLLARKNMRQHAQCSRFNHENAIDSSNIGMYRDVSMEISLWFPRLLFIFAYVYFILTWKAALRLGNSGQ